MTDKQLKTEWRYRYEERLGILMDGRPGDPTPDEKILARKEANQWLSQQTGELTFDSEFRNRL